MFSGHFTKQGHSMWFLSANRCLIPSYVAFMDTGVHSQMLGYTRDRKNQMSLPLSDIYSYAIIKMLLNSIFSLLPTSSFSSKFKRYFDVRQLNFLYVIRNTWVCWRIPKFCELEPYIYSQKKNSIHTWLTYITGIPSHHSPTYACLCLSLHKHVKIYVQFQIFINAHYRSHFLTLHTMRLLQIFEIMNVEQFVRMRTGRMNLSTWRKPAPMPSCPPQIPLDLTGV